MSLKRAGSTLVDTNKDPRRVKPTGVNYQSLTIKNFSEIATVHQTCNIISGECHTFENSADDFVSVTVTDCFDEKHAPQNWPVKDGHWKAIVMLTAGVNIVEIALHHSGGICESRVISMTLEPLLQLPPLLLAVLVAKDSPLLIDCPPAKSGAISTTHSDLNAAISKFRMSAYMWQALTAEDFHSKGLGRRSFRLEEEWAADSTTEHGLRRNVANASKMGSVAKVHLVRTDKTVAELRQARYAQQNKCASHANELHSIFERALKAHGAPFEASSKPVVAGLILDSTFDIDQNLIVGHAALGCHNPNGLSLGIFGSHLTHSWPRFLEEVPACLLDQRLCGETVGNDNGECETLSGACFVGQGAFLHEVGHAFGADHTTGIMARGYSKDWYKNFLGNHVYPNSAEWDLEDALKFKLLPHFKVPGDGPITKEFKAKNIEVDVEDSTDGEETLLVKCDAGIARLELRTKDNLVFHSQQGVEDPRSILKISITSMDRTKEVELKVLAMNGKTKLIGNIWKLLSNRPYVKVPGTNFRFERKSVKSSTLEARDVDEDRYCNWAMLLNEKGKDGTLTRATAIDLRVGCTMDGGVVYYEDGHRTNCGPADKQHFGGHASQKRNLPIDVEITSVKLNDRECGWGNLSGISMTLADGTTWGHLNHHPSRGESANICVLKPKDGHKIVGFFGRSEHSGWPHEFGILTAPRDEEIPAAAYDMVELRNVSSEKDGEDRDEYDEDDEEEEEDEDSDDDYDGCSEHTVE